MGLFATYPPNDCTVPRYGTSSQLTACFFNLQKGLCNLPPAKTCMYAQHLGCSCIIVNVGIISWYVYITHLHSPIHHLDLNQPNVQVNIYHTRILWVIFVFIFTRPFGLLYDFQSTLLTANERNVPLTLNERTFRQKLSDLTRGLCDL